MSWMDLIVATPTVACCFLLGWCLSLSRRLYSIERHSKLDPLTGLGSGHWLETERWQAALPAPLADYVGLVRAFNPDGQLRQYPGSPAIANLVLRDTDRLRAYELHPTDHRILASYLEARPNTQVSDRDGFAAIKAELPSPTRRAALLMDPPYEIKTDYAKVLTALREALERAADTVVMIWYPQLQLLESTQLATRLKASADAAAKKGWLHVRLTVTQADERGFGMMGSGMFIANPPFTLHDELAECLPVLVDRLGQFDGANYVLERKAV